MKKQRPLNRTEEQERLCELVEAAKKLSVYPNVTWSSDTWELPRTHRAHDKRRLLLHFTCRRLNRVDPFVPFEQPFADFAKAMVRMRASLRRVGYGSQKEIIITLRFLYSALTATGTTDPTMITPRHFYTAVADASQKTEPWTAYAVGKSLKEIATFIEDHRLTPIRINFHNPLIIPTAINRTENASENEGVRKMPSLAALNALANASNNPVDDDERVLLRTIDLLVVGGFRVGEVLTLPLNCWVEELAYDQNGKPKTNVLGEQIKHYGLRYWPEKGGVPVVKWLPDYAVQLAKRAVDDLTQLCASARQVAAVIEKNPDRVPLPGKFSQDDLLSRRQLEKVLGLRGYNAVRSFLEEQMDVKPFVVGRHGVAHLYRVGDIEKALVGRCGQLKVLQKPNGKIQMLSQSLCVKFINQFNSTRATLFFLPEVITYSDITSALGSDKEVTSIYSRRDFIEADGTPMRIRTHAFRHWLNTLADKGGLSDIDLALWMGRRDFRQNAAYKHGTVEQRVAWAQEMIVTGTLQGMVADTYHSINDPVEKQDFLTTFVTAAHFTPYGVCVHDFAQEPCKYHLNCLNGCSEYLRTKGDLEEQHNLQELRLFTLGELKKATEAYKNETWGASNWVDFNRRNLAGIDTALAVDESESNTGETIRVFPQGGRLGQPIATK